MRWSGSISDARQVTLAELKAQVLALEGALERRSDELRLIQRRVCSHDLVVISQILSRSAPPNPFDIGFWEESVELTESDVVDVMRALWRSIDPRWRE